MGGSTNYHVIDIFNITVDVAFIQLQQCASRRSNLQIQSLIQNISRDGQANIQIAHDMSYC